ncbi:hypothetical protein ACSW8L_15805 (plasmid) [Clostridium perfringens]
MNRSSLLTLGMGQCGNILAESMKRYKNIYSTAYINSSYGDLTNLKFAMEGNTFIFNGADGSGSNRELANEFAENDEMRLMDFFKDFIHFKTILIYLGMGGGTGSGSFKKTVKTIKKVLPHIVINVVGIIPSKKEGSKQLINAIQCFEDVLSLYNDGYLNDIKFAYNGKRKNILDINKEIVTMIDKEYTMTNHTIKFGSIDSSDLLNITAAKGYGMILELPDRDLLFDEALRSARDKSVFILPDEMICTYGGANITDRYDLKEITDSVIAKDTFYTTLNKSNKNENPKSTEINLIALGGCAIPTGIFRELEKELEDREKNSISINQKVTFKSKYSSTNTSSDSEEKVKTVQKPIISRKSVIEELDDSAFNFDFDLD